MAITTVQARFRFRTDSAAADTAAAWAAAEDTAWTPSDFSAKFRLRFTINSTGTTATASSAWQLYCARNGGAYAPVTTTTLFVQSADASASADETAITANQLTAGSGTRVNGVYDESGATAAKILGATSYMELEYGLAFAGAAEGDTYDFRVYLAGVALSTYTVTPRITVLTETKTVARSLKGYQFSNDASSLTGSSINKLIEPSGATAGTWTAQSLGASASVVGSFFTPASDPGSATISYALARLAVTTGNTNLRFAVRLLRVNSAGIVQATGLYAAETVSGAAATYLFEPPVSSLGVFAATDQLRIDVQIRNSSVSTGQSCTITYASADCSVHAGWSTADMRWNYANKGPAVNLSAADLTATTSGTNTFTNILASTQIPPGAKVVWEVVNTFTSNTSYVIGIANQDIVLQGASAWLGVNTKSVGLYGNGQYYYNGAVAATLTPYSTGDRLQVAVDAALKRFWVRNLTQGKTWNEGTAFAGDPAFGTGGVDLSALTGLWHPVVGLYTLNDAVTAAFTGLSAAAPLGFTALEGPEFIAGVVPRKVKGYQFSNDASSLTGSSLNKLIEPSGASAGTWAAQSLGASAEVIGSFFTPPGDPGGAAISYARVNLAVTTGNTNLRYAARLLRVDSSGAVQATGAYAPETISGGTGVHVFEPPITALGTFGATDQLRADVRIRNASASTGQSCTITYATPDCSVQCGWSNADMRLNYADMSPNIALSNNDKTATRTAGANAYSNIRSTVMAPTGSKVLCEVVTNAFWSSGSFAVGIGTLTVPVVGDANFGYLGYSAYSLGFFADGSVYLGHLTASPVAVSWTAGQRVQLAVDTTLKKAWIRNLTTGGGWNNKAIGLEDPAAGLGGVSFSSIPDSPFYFMFGAIAVPDEAVVEFSNPVGAIPAGFTAWDSGSFAAGAYSLALARGTAALAGQALTPRAARTLSLAQGAVPVAGQAAAAVRGRPLVLSRGTVPVTGQPLGLVRARTLGLAQGTVPAAGKAVTAVRARTLGLAFGAVPLSGQAVRVAGGRTLVLSRGTAAAAGQAVRLAGARILVLSRGTAALTGQAAVLLKYTPVANPALALGAGTIPVSGKTALLIRARTVTLASGTAAITGKVLTLTALRRLALSAGVIAVAGQAIQLAPTAARAITLAKGAVPVAGKVLTLAAARRLVLSRGVLPVAGKALSFSLSSIRIDLAHGTITVSGRAVQLLYTRSQGPAATLSADGCISYQVAIPTTGCCPPPLCGNDLCCTFVAFFNLLPSGPLWDLWKARAIDHFQRSDNPAECPLVQDPDCPSLVLHAIYAVLRLKQYTYEALWPALRESDPVTACTTLDDWLRRLQWEDCYRQHCRSVLLGELTPYEVWSDCGPLFCDVSFPPELEEAVKKGIVIALTRAQRGVIKNVCGLNWIIEPLGAEIQPVYPLPKPAHPTAPEACGSLGRCAEDIAFTVCPTSDWLDGVGPCGPCDTHEPPPQVQAYWDRGCDRPAGLPDRIWPGVLAAECIARSMMPPTCPSNFKACC